jgi:uncharacterized protein (TIGR00251 family)
LSDALAIRAHAGGVRVAVRVQPRASREEIRGVRNGVLEVALSAPPVDGRANAALIALLAERLQVPRRAVSLVRGETGRDKLVAIEGIAVEDALARLSSA